MKIFSFLRKIVTKMVTWTLRKIGSGFRDIGKQLLNYSIDISDKPVRETVLTSIDEVDMFGKYDDLVPSEPVPLEKIIETHDRLTRNYITKLQVFYRIPGIDEPRAEWISVMHDTNLSEQELRVRVAEILDRYAVEMGAEKAEIIKIDRMAVLHKSGAPY